MHTFSFEKERFEPDPNGAMATRMLLSHFTGFWSKLVGLSCA